MRCDDCQEKPLGESRYCECCGRQVSVPEEQAIEPLPSPALDDLFDDLTRAGAAPEPPVARCESCGGPAGDADLCDACQRAFHTVIETAKSAAPTQAPAPVVPDPAADGDRPSPSTTASATSAAPAALPAGSPNVPGVPFGSIAPLPAPAAPSAAASAAAAVATLTPPAPIALKEPAPVREPVPARELTRPMPRPRPVPPPELRGAPAVAPPPSGGRTRSLFVAGALVVVALAVCVPLATPWLASEQPAPAPREEAPTEEAPSQEAVAQHAPAAPRPAEPAPADDIAPDPPDPPVRQTRPVRHEAPAAAPAPRVEALAESSLPAAEPVAAAAPPAEAPAAPIGPFFEIRQVNESPQVLSRIEPDVPGELQGPLNDVVIVRVLISQTGHVSLVNVLRRSKAGVALDDAVVEAVKQWTFSPARRRGEAVSCWYHVGIPVQRAG